MKSAIVHGGLLVMMLAYGYRTWNAAPKAAITTGEVVLWNKAEGDIAAIEYTSNATSFKRTVSLTRKTDAQGSYWWGTETTITQRPKPTPATAPAADGSAGSAAGAVPNSPTAGTGSAVGTAAGSAQGSANNAVAAAGSAKGSATTQGSAAGAAASDGSAGSAAAPAPAKPEMEDVTNTQFFPIGEAGEKLIGTLAKARALRDVGALSESAKKDYGLDDPKASLTVRFGSDVRTFAIGTTLYGGADRYALDTASKRAYVLSKEMLSALEGGAVSLRLVDPRGFDLTKLHAADISAGGKTRNALKVKTSIEGTQAKVWGDAKTQKPDQTLGNFVDNAGALRPTEYKADVAVATLTPVVAVSYRDESGAVLGAMTLYKRPAAATAAPAPGSNASTATWEYFLVTPKTRVPGVIAAAMAEKIENDLTTVFVP